MIWNCLNFKWASLHKERRCKNEDKSSIGNVHVVLTNYEILRIIWERGVSFCKENSNVSSKIVSLVSVVEGLSEANQIAWRWGRRAWWVVKTKCHLNKYHIVELRCSRALYKRLKYSLFQNSRQFSILLFSCKLALVVSFLNSKFKRRFSLQQGNNRSFSS